MRSVEHEQTVDIAAGLVSAIDGHASERARHTPYAEIHRTSTQEGAVGIVLLLRGNRNGFEGDDVVSRKPGVARLARLRG